MASENVYVFDGGRLVAIANSYAVAEGLIRAVLDDEPGARLVVVPASEVTS